MEIQFLSKLNLTALNSIYTNILGNPWEYMTYRWVVLSGGREWGAILHPKGHLAISADIFNQNDSRWGCYWYLVGKAQGCCQTSCKVQDSPQPNII